MTDTTTSMSLTVAHLATGTDRGVILRALRAALWIWAAVALDEPWTPQRAHAWWEQHRP